MHVQRRPRGDRQQVVGDELPVGDQQQAVGLEAGQHGSPLVGSDASRRLDAKPLVACPCGDR